MYKKFSDEVEVGIISIASAFGFPLLSLFLFQKRFQILGIWIPLFVYVLYLFSKHSKKTPLARLTDRYSDSPLLWSIIAILSGLAVFLFSLSSG